MRGGISGGEFSHPFGGFIPVMYRVAQDDGVFLTGSGQIHQELTLSYTVFSDYETNAQFEFPMFLCHMAI